MFGNSKFFNQYPGKDITEADIKRIFQTFDANKDNALDKAEVKNLVESIATSGSLSAAELDKIYAFLDKDKDGLVSPSDMAARALPWLSVIFSGPVAMVIVDVQNDFITGSLALKVYPAKEDGANVVPVINDVIAKHSAAFKTVIYSLDWHPADHISFLDNLAKRKLSDKSKIKDAAKVGLNDVVVLETKAYGPIEQIMWPRHCVQNSSGAELHSELKLAGNHTKVYKGTDPDIDSYSAFWDNNKLKKTDLHDRLSKLGISDLIVCGLATDVCVGSTAAHAQELGYRTALLEDACCGVMPDGIAATKAKLTAAHGVVVRSGQLNELLAKRDRPMAWVLAAVDCVEKLANGSH
uniref:nicotinamidase n=3 Tax=Macrostomum lignano TaxID=282301 RepID=A0A1I8JJI6_9PLAT